MECRRKASPIRKQENASEDNVFWYFFQKKYKDLKKIIMPHRKAFEVQ